MATQNARPDARVVAADADANACRCAAKNDVEVYDGHLAQPIPTDLIGKVDVVVAVVPYIAIDEIIFLPGDASRYEPRAALVGAVRGTELLKQAASSGTRLLRTGGSLLLELGGGQDLQLAPAGSDTYCQRR